MVKYTLKILQCENRKLFKVCLTIFNIMHEKFKRVLLNISNLYRLIYQSWVLLLNMFVPKIMLLCQLIFTCSKLTIETPEKGVKYVQS